MMTIEEKCMRNTIDMALEAGFKEHNGLIYVTTINDDCAKELKAFEALVRADERERVMNEPLTKANWQRFEDEIRADEREACAKVCESFQQDPYEELLYKSDFAAAIRARGEASIRSKA
jgi:uncharacterized protein YbaA (DUF1428 family)